MLYYFKKGKNTTEMQKKICAVYAENAVTNRMCQKRFAKFHAGDFLLDDAPQSGRSVEADRDQVETLTENNQHYTTQEIADILKISKSIKLLVKMKSVSFMEKSKWAFWPARFLAKQCRGGLKRKTGQSPPLPPC